ncbi:hypothetical protein [Asticcacaulis endophyticus]|uniref:Uncharacterized protein n=1 Tax=Asticcacaulis endophyticus TaxID=1395890 RepID=A0A918PTQ2_9CAUL|nr:hypothetical protein [Asticcacaulis endophyticus]GGZ21663.1 hypothetical protein GCM10011273_03040 [Asticcacaulis endophyticus]
MTLNIGDIVGGGFEVTAIDGSTITVTGETPLSNGPVNLTLEIETFEIGFKAWLHSQNVPTT